MSCAPTPVAKGSRHTLAGPTGPTQPSFDRELVGWLPKGTGPWTLPGDFHSLLLSSCQAMLCSGRQKDPTLLLRTSESGWGTGLTQGTGKSARRCPRPTQPQAEGFEMLKGLLLCSQVQSPASQCRLHPGAKSNYDGAAPGL